ncbi:MAG: hypothetical protein ACOYEW_17195 [Anaerolineae bacterium]
MGSYSSGNQDDRWEVVHVSCRSDYVYAQEPQRIRWADGWEDEVSEVLLRWQQPQGRHFLVRAGGRRVELAYRQAEDLWLARVRVSPPAPVTWD